MKSSTEPTKQKAYIEKFKVQVKGEFNKGVFIKTVRGDLLNPKSMQNVYEYLQWMNNDVRAASPSNHLDELIELYKELADKSLFFYNKYKKENNKLQAEFFKNIYSYTYTYQFSLRQHLILNEGYDQLSTEKKRAYELECEYVQSLSSPVYSHESIRKQCALRGLSIRFSHLHSKKERSTNISAHEIIQHIRDLLKTQEDEAARTFKEVGIYFLKCEDDILTALTLFKEAARCQLASSNNVLYLDMNGEFLKHLHQIALKSKEQYTEALSINKKYTSLSILTKIKNILSIAKDTKEGNHPFIAYTLQKVMGTEKSKKRSIKKAIDAYLNYVDISSFHQDFRGQKKAHLSRIKEYDEDISIELIKNTNKLKVILSDRVRAQKIKAQIEARMPGIKIKASKGGNLIFQDAYYQIDFEDIQSCIDLIKSTPSEKTAKKRVTVSELEEQFGTFRLESPRPLTGHHYQLAAQRAKERSKQGYGLEQNESRGLEPCAQTCKIAPHTKALDTLPNLIFRQCTGHRGFYSSNPFVALDQSQLEAPDQRMRKKFIQLFEHPRMCGKRGEQGFKVLPLNKTMIIEAKIKGQGGKYRVYPSDKYMLDGQVFWVFKTIVDKMSYKAKHFKLNVVDLNEEKQEDKSGASPLPKKPS